MAVLNPRMPAGNIISGKIVLKETGAGIPDLLVVVLDLDPGTRPEEGFSSPTTTTTVALSTNTVSRPERLGSVLSSSDGSWSLSYDDTEFRNQNDEKRPDIQLMVLGPEDADSDNAPAVLYSSKMLRINAGKTESCLIRIASKQLMEAGIPLPSNGQSLSPSSSKIEKFRQKKLEERNLQEGLKQVNEEFDTHDSEPNKEVRKTVKELILPDRAILASMYNFVKEDASIEEVQNNVYKKGSDDIDQQLNTNDPSDPRPGKGIKMYLVLSQADKDELAAFRFDFEGKSYFNITESKIQQLLFKKETDDGINSILFSNNPISRYCIEKSVEEKKVAIDTGLLPPEEEHNEDEGDGGTTTPGAGINESDIARYLEQILVQKDTDRFHDNGNFKGKRPNDKTVQANVDKFALQKGPADTTAFYDFHSLQIAFQHVWQQLLDETLVNLSEKIHNDLESNGRKGLLTALKQKMAGLRTPGLQTMVGFAVEAGKYHADKVPTDISSAFDISFLEYDALSGEDKDKLLKLAIDINKYEADPEGRAVRTVDLPGWLPEISVPTGPDYATLALVLRDQGERLIDNVRINKPNTTNQLLKELQERLLSKYEFTVFAADRNYHSINFGIMNTFRQQWEPISYQAGKLVKTIPLSPKEERKYSVKTTVNTKVTRKQAQKHNSTLQQEINTTSRAESEIVAKANDKSNFNMSVKLDYSHISSQLTFGKDAAKETSQSKKEFREAVIKAAQEFKEERNLEIDTEQTDSSEYNESGSITNPNDELSVTYLFYELQRRYRVSEQLYRVMPVVMVAQQVPSPDQITEAWIVAHDWIINRVLLDDSFRPALQYLAQRNVGDDFAIRELRKNLRQQRTLVTQLQLEFSKLKQDVNSKYNAMERSIQERINQEHIKRTYRWWWWWSQNGRPDTPPDPEMAKALEQAATDEHKYAVEKAEKMSLSVQREVNALHQLTIDYNNEMREHLDLITQTRRLIAHIKENILFYMQAIWSMEPPDQRFMRLYKVKVPAFEATRSMIIEDKTIAPGEIDEDDIFSAFREPGKVRHNAWLHGQIVRDAAGQPVVTQKDLVEVADLDTVLGFKGNYMIFPMKEHNALTEMMAAPYIDEAFGAMDPDQLSNVNLAEYARYVRCLHEEKPEEYERLKPVLRKWLELLLADPLRNGDEIIVPTGSLFIEMLPSDKSLLEDFKLQHRQWDVYKVQAEVRKMELENIRYAARLLNDETGDPDVDKQIIVSGNGIHTDIDLDNQ